MYVIKKIIKKISTLIRSDVILGVDVDLALRGVFFEGDNAVGDRSRISSARFGRGTYCSFGCNLSSVNIGKFCSIGPNVTCMLGQHPVRDFVSTHPAFFSLKKQSGFTFVKENLFSELSNDAHSINIGNDVWIGGGVILLDGVTISDGAIIGAGCVVSKDIPPYAIVVGSPMRILRYRFSDDEIRFLLELKWWDKPDDWLREKCSYLSDIKSLIKNL
jgi:acetyltransferase-like isoleucine patch superfamily enzyme